MNFSILLIVFEAEKGIPGGFRFSKGSEASKTRSLHIQIGMKGTCEWVNHLMSFLSRKTCGTRDWIPVSKPVFFVDFLGLTSPEGRCPQAIGPFVVPLNFRGNYLEGLKKFTLITFFYPVIIRYPGTLENQVDFCTKNQTEGTSDFRKKKDSMEATKGISNRLTKPEISPRTAILSKSACHLTENPSQPSSLGSCFSIPIGSFSGRFSFFLEIVMLFSLPQRLWDERTKP